jgi:hypothetical protein
VGIIRGLSVDIITENYEKEKEVKGSRVNPTLRLMLSPNYETRACKKGIGMHEKEIGSAYRIIILLSLIIRARYSE